MFGQIIYIVLVLTYACLETLRKFIRSDKNREKKEEEEEDTSDSLSPISRYSRPGRLSSHKPITYPNSRRKDPRNVCSLSKQPDRRGITVNPLRPRTVLDVNSTGDGASAF